MCILCDADSLRLLVVPLEELSTASFVESIRVAREAAMQLVLDTADAWADVEADEEPAYSVDPDGFVRYVVDRAEQSDLLDRGEVRAWRQALRSGGILSDPRVQAFLSSSAEGLALYSAQIRDKRGVLERFLELRPGKATFGGVGRSGEIFFDLDDFRYIVLSDDEAMQIAMEQISSELWKEDPNLLLRYSSLPDEAIGLLTTAQQGPQERANEILAGIIDLPLLVEDTVRQHGYGRFVTEGIADEFTEQRFGDMLVLRIRVPEDVDEGEFF
jgi:hypothetical protein